MKSTSGLEGVHLCIRLPSTNTVVVFDAEPVYKAYAKLLKLGFDKSAKFGLDWVWEKDHANSMRIESIRVILRGRRMEFTGKDAIKSFLGWASNN